MKMEINEAFTSRERQYMHKLIDDLTKTIGSCERIVQTPVPLTYARHTSRFLSLFCLTAPVALVSELGFYIIPFVPLTAWSLFGIQEIGMIIEEPFQRALKLEIFSNTIRRDIADLLHVTRLNKRRMNIKSAALGYEIPFFNLSPREVLDDEEEREGLKREELSEEEKAAVEAAEIKLPVKANHMSVPIEAGLKSMKATDDTDTITAEDHLQ